MNVIDKLASSLGRRDDVPNQELAKEIADSNNNNSIAQLVEILKNTKDKKLQSDCIKTLYEVGYLKPELISDHYKFFLELLKNKNNRLVWGAMIALNTISKIKPKEIYENLVEIMDATDKGSVITKDNGIGILINLSSKAEYSNEAFPLLLEQLRKCQSKQLPMYAERTLPIINEKNKKEFIDILIQRFDELEKESQKKRIEKVLKKLN